MQKKNSLVNMFAAKNDDPKNNSSFRKGRKYLIFWQLILITSTFHQKVEIRTKRKRNEDLSNHIYFSSLDTFIHEQVKPY